MPATDEIIAIMITLHQDKQQVLFLLLDADGGVNRMGTGLGNARDKPIFIGKTKKKLFARLRTKITPGAHNVAYPL